MLERNKIICADVREGLKLLPDNSIQCVITSPPYFGLRSYLPGDSPDKPLEIGLEKTLDEYVQNMVEIFREVRRVLRSDGCLWINLGDSFANDTKWGGQSGEKNYTSAAGGYGGQRLKRNTGLKPKDLVGAPWRVAFALQADGWWLRMDIIWAKPNPMPESVTDRPTKSHEYIFLLTKRQKYFYDAEAVKEPADISKQRSKPVNATEAAGNTSSGDRRINYEKTRHVVTARNKRSVWTVATQPFPESHFAVFPEKLIEPCILAGTAPQACEKCGAPWRRAVERVRQPRGDCFGKRHGAFDRGQAGSPYLQAVDVQTLGWRPTCSCPEATGSGKCIVLDPFMGAGTTALVAAQHGRDYIGIEISPEYCKMAEKRVKEATAQQRLFTEVT